ncbi:MAG: phosphonate ABC transporter, permease protein PhnE [Polyangiaceae bacterium]|nr:phosphonate ABC transporter, permease protein PhnE [Polyangiaceae bacterium]
MTQAPPRPARRPPEAWALRQPFGPRTVAIALIATVLLAASARHTQIDRMAWLSVEYVEHLVGLRAESEVARGVDRFVSTAFPFVLAEEEPVARIEHFDPQHLPFGAHLATREKSTSTYDYALQKMVTHIETEQVLVRPFGYLALVLEKMVETLEIAVWGTLLAVVWGAPLAFFGTRRYSPHVILYAASRGISAFLRAIPELVSVLILVLAYGFGPGTAALALGLHSTGFLGKFYADDVENADPGPQEALASVGANGVKVLWFGAIPQVLPQYIAYTQYILERNVRMATVVGVVGAGGIGVELKGRFDTFDFGHVSTILAVILVTILALERASQWVRSKLL